MRPVDVSAAYDSRADEYISKLGAGRPLFATGHQRTVELELVRTLEGRDATHLRYRVSRRTP